MVYAFCDFSIPSRKLSINRLAQLGSDFKFRITHFPLFFFNMFKFSHQKLISKFPNFRKSSCLLGHSKIEIFTPGPNNNASVACHQNFWFGKLCSQNYLQCILWMLHQTSKSIAENRYYFRKDAHWYRPQGSVGVACRQSVKKWLSLFFPCVPHIDFCFFPFKIQMKY